MFQIVKDEVIKPAFAKLRKRGYIARMNYLCCGTCLSYGLSEIAEKKGKKGYLGWHRQDTEKADRLGYIHIGYGVDKNQWIDEETLAKDIARELMTQAYKWNADVGNREVWVDWDWSTDTRIKLAWRMP